jgi:Tfp pilus assembly protein PilP
MSSQKRLTIWMLPAALAMAALIAAAQPSKPAQGAIKTILNKAGEMKTAGAAHEAAVEQAQKGTPPAKAPDPKAGQKTAAPTAAGTVEKAKQVASKAGAAAKGTTDAAGRRDPFVNPIREVPASAAPPPQSLPPGIGGLLIGQANLVGVLKTSAGMKAMVVATGGRTFFLKENDKVYNGRVVKITADSLVFEESVLDPLGQTVKREVVKKLPADK